MAFLRGNSTVFLLFLTMALQTHRMSVHSAIFPHPLSKHAFTEISKCAGVYDLNLYAQMTEICHNCYNLYRDPEIFRECRKDCFSNLYFKGCVEVLQIPETKGKIVEGLSVIHPHLDQHLN